MVRNVVALLLLAGALLFFIAAPGLAQVQHRPTDPPIVTAANESWYQLREPIQVSGDVYYPAGAAVFFDSNVMVRTGHYNGVPLYANTTLEPFSVVFVPVSRGQMQPYERRRSGTTASRAPSFPVRVVPETQVYQAPAAPTGLPMSPGAVAAHTPETPVAARSEPGAVGTSGRAVTVRRSPPLTSVRRPDSNDGVWVLFGGERWISAGPAVSLLPSEFVLVGEHGGFPVYAREALEEDVIYLPTRSGLLAPYRLKD
jgi:hypothetical protein